MFRIRSCTPAAFLLAMAPIVGVARTAAAQPFPGVLPGIDIGHNLPGGFEGSGATWHPRLQRLLIVSDSGLLASVEADGSLYDGAFVGGDLEGVTVADPESDFVYVTRENPHAVLEVDLASRSVTRTFLLAAVLTGSANQGPEAITFVPDAADPEGGLFHVGQQSNGRVYVFRLPIASSAVDTTPTLVFSYTPLPGTTDISALEYDHDRHKVYALFDGADRLVELTTAGAFVQQWTMPGSDQEGLAIRGCELYATEDTSTQLFKYHDFPALADCEAFSAQAMHVSVAAGGSVEFVLRAVGTIPSLYGYLVLGSATGTSPGIRVGGTVLPLQVDGYFHLTASHGNAPPFVNTLGAFDAAGRASAFLLVPPLPPVLVGVDLHHAFVAFHPVTHHLVGASQAQTLRFVP